MINLHDNTEINSIEELQYLIDNDLSIEEIKARLFTKTVQDTNISILTLRAKVKESINKLQEPIPGLKYSDINIINRVLTSLNTFNNLLLELNSAGTIIKHYQDNLGAIIDSCIYQDINLLSLLRNYSSFEEEQNILIESDRYSDNLIKEYQNMESIMLSFLEYVKKAPDNLGIDPDNFNEKIEVLSNIIEKRYTLSYCQGVLSSMIILIGMLGPSYNPMRALSALGTDIWCTIFAFYRVTRRSQII